eukprot:9165351-Pyramimonas_sp.AAC.1
MSTLDPELGPAPHVPVPTLLSSGPLMAHGSWSTPPHLTPTQGERRTGQFDTHPSTQVGTG